MSPNLKLVHTPLNGSGLNPSRCCWTAWRDPGHRGASEQGEADGSFPTCPYPNPEIREAMETGLKLVTPVKPDLMLSGTDPDCDRIIPPCRMASGGYRLITGSAFDYICRTRIGNGTMPVGDPVAVTTIVSTETWPQSLPPCGMAGAAPYLTGFGSSPGEQILLEAEGHPERA